MEKEENKKENVQSGLNIRISLENDDTIEFIDNIDLPEEYKKETLYPYLKDIYRDLSQRGENPNQGIEKAILVEVSMISHYLVCGDSRVAGRQDLPPVRHGEEQLCTTP